MMDHNEQAQIDEMMGRLRARGASCGDCNLCCTIMAVDMATLPEPNKPARARCGHMCKSGCSIYDAKPDSRSEEHTSELQSLMRISYAVFCLKNKTTTCLRTNIHSTVKV